MATCMYPWLGYIVAFLIAWTVLLVIKYVILPILQCMAFSYFAGKKERNIPTILKGVTILGAAGAASGQSAEEILCSGFKNVGEAIDMDANYSVSGVAGIPDGSTSLTFTFKTGTRECSKIKNNDNITVYTCFVGEIIDLTTRPLYMFPFDVDTYSPSVTWKGLSGQDTYKKKSVSSDGFCTNTVRVSGPECEGCELTYSKGNPADQCKGQDAGCVRSTTSDSVGSVSFRPTQIGRRAGIYTGAKVNTITTTSVFHIYITRPDVSRPDGVRLFEACIWGDSAEILTEFPSMKGTRPDFLLGYGFTTPDPSTNERDLGTGEIEIIAQQRAGSLAWYYGEIPDIEDWTWGPAIRWPIGVNDASLPDPVVTADSQCAQIIKSAPLTCICWPSDKVVPDTRELELEIPQLDYFNPLEEFVGAPIAGRPDGTALGRISASLPTHGAGDFTLFLKPGSFREVVDPIACIDIYEGSATFISGATDRGISTSFNFSYALLTPGGMWTETIATNGSWGSISDGQSIIIGDPVEIMGIFNVSQDANSIEFPLTLRCGAATESTTIISLSGIPHAFPPTPSDRPREYDFTDQPGGWWWIVIVVVICVVVVVLITLLLIYFTHKYPCCPDRTTKKTT